MIVDLTRDERRQRRVNVITEILDGKQQTETAVKYNLSVSYVMYLIRSHCKKINPELFESILVYPTPKELERCPNSAPYCMIDDIQANSEKFMFPL